MKYLSHILITVLVLQSGEVFGARTLRRYLELEGKIFQTGFDAKGTQKYLDSALLVIVNSETGDADSIFTAESGAYLFRLPLNSDYMITVSKTGFISKRIHVSSRVPLFSTGYYGIEFELSLYKQIQGLDVSLLLSAPVADLNYYRHKKTFDYDHAYTEQVNHDLKRIYAAYYSHRAIPAIKMRSKVSANSATARKGKKKALRIFSGRIKR